MKTKFLRLIYLLAVLPVIAVAGCDDTIDVPGAVPEYPEGSCNVRFIMDYEPFTGQPVSARGVSGKTMDVLDDLCLVAYDKDGNIMAGFPMDITAGANGLEVDYVNRGDADASNGFLAESKTWQAKFTANIPYGQYYLYAVSNLGARDTEGNRQQSTYDFLSARRDEISSRMDFLNMRTEWNESNPYDNFQMLGHFYAGDTPEKAPFTAPTTNDVLVTVSRPDMQLHAWLRRCASKVTVDFDGSALDPYVKVWIRRATIHDIASSCRIGMPNAAADQSELIAYKDGDYSPTGLNVNNTIEYGQGADHSTWPLITQANPSFLSDAHAQDAESLFLYENMQGEQGDSKNKTQQPDADGTVVGAGEKKDNVPEGSYIEVEGYYSYQSQTESHEGRIIYRFMLGKDALNNFDVERNHHYKLTMKLRGKGNDVDWHIEYDRKQGFEWKNPYYVSYVYDQTSTISFNFTPASGKKLDRIEAEIIGNNWWPSNPDEQCRTQAKNAQIPFTAEPDYVNSSAYTIKTANIYKASDYDNSALGQLYKQMDKRTKYLGNGFLSLYHEKEVTLSYADVTGISNMSGWNTKKDAASVNDIWFYGVSPNARKIDGQPVDQSRRVYKADYSTYTDQSEENYTFRENQDGSVHVSFPVFTRPKNLIKQTGFSGNNPYDGSVRDAYVLVKVFYTDNKTSTPDEQQIMRVEQVRRLTNPKGIYRSYNNNQNFNVELLQLESSSDNSFSSFTSDGPWMAEVLGDQNFITLNGRSTVKGNDGSPIKFEVRFNKMNRSKTVRNAIIRVRYNNYCCVHLIFVRQGYSSQAISSDGTLWYATNAIHTGLDAGDPRDEGSLFKYGNLDEGIDVYSNGLNWNYNILPGVTEFASWAKPGNLYLADVESKAGVIKDSPVSWSSIIGNTGDDGKKVMSDAGVAEMQHYTALFGSAASYDSYIKHAFGILYADGATSPQTSLDMAWGYNRHESGTEKRGVRGLFVYYWDGSRTGEGYNCNNMFFPIGRAGYGHRRANDHMQGGKDKSTDGTLRYAAGRDSEMDASLIDITPLFYDLYRRQGAIYWAREVHQVMDVTNTDMPNAMAFDINYYTFDVNVLQKSNLQKHEQWNGCSDPDCIDACFVRRVGAYTEPDKTPLH